MFLDASVVVAILGEEPDWREHMARLQDHLPNLFYSPIVRFESVTAISRLVHTEKASGSRADMLRHAGQIFDDFMRQIGATEIDITADTGRLAIEAAATYDKIVGHRAALNFGDCFSYAAARTLGSGLLYKGEDFAATDLA